MNSDQQESMLVPDEQIEEELPLRIRTLQYGEDRSDDSLHMEYPRF
jgi:hypothetical protein